MKEVIFNLIGRINMKKICYVLFLAIILGIGLTACSKKEPSEDTDKDPVITENKDALNDEKEQSDDKNPATAGNGPSGSGESADTEYKVFEADVIEAGERLLVAPDKESTEYSSSDKIYVGMVKAAEKPESVKPGDRIKIYYNGMIAESYPAQISADKIEVTGHNRIIDGIFTLIDDIYREDTALNDGIAMIAFNMSKLESLTDTEIETVLAMAKEEFGLDVIQGTFDELAEQGLIDKEKLYFEKGVLIEIKDDKISGNKSKISCTISKWRSGLGAIGWDAKAEFDGENWTVTRKNLWIS